MYLEWPYKEGILCFKLMAPTFREGITGNEETSYTQKLSAYNMWWSHHKKLNI